MQRSGHHLRLQGRARPSLDLSTITDFTARLDERAATSGVDKQGAYDYGAEGSTPS